MLEEGMVGKIVDPKYSGLPYDFMGRIGIILPSQNSEGFRGGYIKLECMILLSGDIGIGLYMKKVFS